MRKLTDGTNVDAPTGDYPKGRTRDKAGAIPGTIGNEVLFGDMVQFFQKLIIDAGITENDLPDNMTNSYQLIEALGSYIRNSGLVKYEKIAFIDCGVEFEITSTGAQMDICAINDTDIAFIDNANDELRTYRFDGNTWSLVGSALSIASTYEAICKLDTDTIALLDGTNLRVYYFDGSTWSTVGNPFATSAFGSMCLISENTIALMDDSIDSLRVYSWNGSDFTLVGTPLTISGTHTPSITYMEDNLIAMVDYGNHEIKMYSWDGSDFTLIGNKFDLGGTYSTVDIIGHNNTDISLIASDDFLRSYRFDGTDWYEYGVRHLSPAASTIIRMAELPTGVLVKIEGTTDMLRCYNRIRLL